MERSGTLNNAAAVVGIGQTDFSTSSGRSELQLALEAAHAAIEDAGIDRKDIDGIIRFGVVQSDVSEAWVAANLGLDDLAYWGSVDFGGSASAAIVAQAAAAVSSGLANYVLCFRAVNGRSGARPGTSDIYDRGLRGADPNYDNFLMPYGLTAPMQVYATIMQRHMHEFGTTSEHLGRIAVTCRENANANPAAQMHGRTMTIEDHAASPLISDPLRKLDCCLQTDGAVAVIVTSAERAASLRHKPALIAGAVQGALSDMQGPLHSILGRRSITETAGANAGRRLWRQTGLRPQDIDVAQFYDCFTTTVMLQLADYGFCEKGDVGAFIDEGNLAIGGSLPINTDGGNLSCAYMHGLGHVIEATRQIRGTSTRQVANAEVCLVTGGTPPPTGALVLAGEPV